MDSEEVGKTCLIINSLSLFHQFDPRTTEVLLNSVEQYDNRNQLSLVDSG